MTLPADFAAPPDGSAFSERRLSTMEWLPPAQVRALEKFGIATAIDLLTHLPHRHED